MRTWVAGLVLAQALWFGSVAAAHSPLRLEERVIGQVDGSPTDIAVARLNRGRTPDIAVAVQRGGEEAGGVQVAVSHSGAFRVEPLVLGGLTPYRVGVGDLDGDGDLDAAVPNTVSQDVTTFANDGAGGLAVGSTVPVPFQTRGIAVADLDRDDRPETVTSSIDDPDGISSAALRILPGDGGPPVTVPAEEFFSPAETILAVDVNRDRRRDLVAVDLSGVWVSHRAAGGFEPLRRIALVEDIPFDIAAADLNRDGLTDLATANLIGTRVAVLMRRSDNTGFEPPRYIDVGAGSAQIGIADFDGDCRNDIAVSRLDAGKVAVLRGAPRGGFHAPQLYDAGPVPLALAAADIDTDGDPDLVVADRDTQELRLLVNRR